MANLNGYIALEWDSSYSDQTNCCCVGMPTVAWFFKMKSEIQIFFFLHEMSLCLKHYGPNKVCLCLQAEFACKTTSLWSLDLEHLYSAVHNKIWTHTLTHPPIHIRTPLYLQYCLMKIKEAFSLSLWTLWIFSVFLKWIVRC